MNRVLIADDDKIFRECIDKVLEIYYPQLEVLHAQDGQEAIIIALTQFPDLILLDGCMPAMSGGQVAEVLRSMPKTLKNSVQKVLASSSSDVSFSQRLEISCARLRISFQLNGMACPYYLRMLF